MATRKKCTPCEAARKMFPKLVRRRLEALEQKMADRKQQKQERK